MLLTHVKALPKLGPRVFRQFSLKPLLRSSCFSPPGGELDPRANPTIENGMLYGQNFEELRQGCLERGELFTDNGKFGSIRRDHNIRWQHPGNAHLNSKGGHFFNFKTA